MPHFVDVERKDELLGLQNRLESCLKAGLGMDIKGRFNPHLTVAFKDLRRKVFPNAWAHFSQLLYERVFQVDALALLQHNGRQWEVFREFSFGG